MTKNIFLSQIFLLFFIACQGNVKTNENLGQQTVVSTEKVSLPDNMSLNFIGYLNSYPVFNNSETYELYLSKVTGKLELYQKYKESLLPKYINNSGIVYFNVDNNDLIVKYFNKTERTVNLGDYIIYLTGNENLDKIYFEDMEGFLNKLDVESGKIQKSNIKGSLPYYSKDEIYFASSIDENEPGLNIFKTDLNLNTKQLVLKNVLGDPWVLAKDKYIICYPEIKNEKLSIYNLETSKYQEVQGENLETWSYYSYQDEAIIFYDPSTFKIKIIKPE